MRISFFNGRDFHDLDDLKAQLAHWSTNIDDERPQRRKQRRTPLELHAEDQPSLLARPRHAYDTARVVYRVCDLEGFVAWDGNRYSLPAENVTELLPVRITQTEIFVYGQDLRLVAQHELRPRGAGELVIAPGHRPKSDRGPGLDQLRVAYRELGDGGKSGTGKSHILQALTLRACEREIRVRYARCVDLIDDLSVPGAAAVASRSDSDLVASIGADPARSTFSSSFAWTARASRTKPVIDSRTVRPPICGGGGGAPRSVHAAGSRNQ